MLCNLKTTCKFLTIIVIFGGTLPAHADSYNDDDVSGLFEYFNKEQQKARDEGVVLERIEGRKKRTSATLSLFGKSADPLPDSFSRNNYRSRDWTKEQPTTILNFRLEF